LDSEKKPNKKLGLKERIEEHRHLISKSVHGSKEAPTGKEGNENSSPT